MKFRIRSPGVKSTPRLAVELGDFRAAKQKLLPHFNQLDDAALVILAMALDGLGEGPEALRILDDFYKSGEINSAEAAGIIAGRVKRRWLLERRAEDLKRAADLYRWGLSEAEKSADHAQAYYHSINLAFLDLISAPATADGSAIVKELATKALDHCRLSPETNWRFATEGEAFLMLGGWKESEEGYRKAVAATVSPRQLISTRNQALLVAGRLRNPTEISELSGWFKPVTDAE